MESQRCYLDSMLYPELLRRVRNAPSLLHYYGDLSILNAQTCVAVIGSREPSPHGLKYAFKVGKMAAESGCVVVNGLAVGCDAEALRGAISVHGKCVAVMPCGVDYIYPRVNESLADDILSNGGCLISEYDDGTRPQKAFFIKRDRIQSGISHGVIVIETKRKGGTMHTVKYAHMQHKRLAVCYNKLLELQTGNEQIIENSLGIPICGDDSISDFLVTLRTERVEEGQQMFLNLI